MLPALFNVEAGLRSVGSSVSKLTKIISTSADASAALSSLADGFNGAYAVLTLQQFAFATSDLAENISGITDASVLSLNVLALSCVNDAINGEAHALFALASVFNDITNGIGATSGVAADLSDAANGFELVVDAKQDLTQSIQNLHAISGSIFSLAVTVTGVTKGLDNLSVAFAGLAAAIQSQSNNWNGVDFSGVIGGLNDLSEAESNLADAVRALVALGNILNLSSGL